MKGIESNKVKILARINFIDSPARKIIIKPEKLIRMDVPKSGCLKIIAQGKANIRNAIECIL
jgi:hypothetical protein